MDGIYRHPTHDFTKFTQMFVTTLGKLAEQKYSCIVAASDINIDLAKNTVHNETTEHVITILFNNLIPLCLELLTRVLLFIDHTFVKEIAK